MLSEFVLNKNMSEKRLTNSFKSYIGDDDESLNTSNDESFSEQFNARLLNGESVAAEAHSVLMFAPVSERTSGSMGVLYVTSFRLSFVSAEDSTKDSVYLDYLLGDNEVCLLNIDAIYLTGDKKRRLIPTKTLSEKVKGLFIVCKNMKTLQFSFARSPVGSGKSIAIALLRHAFPSRHHLLFAYDFKEPYYKLKTETRMFREAGDWGHELARTQCQGWKLCSANIDFHMSTSLPKWLVVPASVLDWQLNEAARHFRCGRPPVWCWSSPRGAALVRMADITPTISDRVQENIMLENVRKSHPRLSQPIVMDLSKDCPSLKDIQASFTKLRDLCAPDDYKQFGSQDNHFYSLLDGSKWLHHVSSCLYKSVEVAQTLYREQTVVLQEADGRDLCCLVASVAQLLIDPYFRTVHGLQTLIQKEWVAMGHPFCSRLRHMVNEEAVEAPVFLLFLDCVWQLTQQFPTRFQFTETFLTALWEVAHLSIFETFLFDCERDRMIAASDSARPLILRSAWEEQLGFRDTRLFYNPLYNKNIGSEPWLPVCPGIPSLEIWLQCYCRHVSGLEIMGGGNPQVDLAARMLVAQIENWEGPFSEAEGGRAALAKVGSFFPFSSSSHSRPAPLTASLLVSSLSLNQSFMISEAMLDSQSILNLPD